MKKGSTIIIGEIYRETIRKLKTAIQQKRANKILCCFMTITEFPKLAKFLK
jgi:polysaccharide deacetylase 2 family uncharacterized protein YibQ